MLPFLQLQETLPDIHYFSNMTESGLATTLASLLRTLSIYVIQSQKFVHIQSHEAVLNLLFAYNNRKFFSSNTFPGSETWKLWEAWLRQTEAKNLLSTSAFSMSVTACSPFSFIRGGYILLCLPPLISILLESSLLFFISLTKFSSRYDLVFLIPPLHIFMESLFSSRATYPCSTACIHHSSSQFELQVKPRWLFTSLAFFSYAFHYTIMPPGNKLPLQVILQNTCPPPSTSSLVRFLVVWFPCLS